MAVVNIIVDGGLQVYDYGFRSHNNLLGYKELEDQAV